MTSNKTFRRNEPTWANACVGDNGASDIIDYASGFAEAAILLIDDSTKDNGLNSNRDTIVYPICFTIRHAIELFLKACVADIAKIAEIRRIQLLPFSLSTSHNLELIWAYIKEHAIKVDERFNNPLIDLDEYILDVANMDATGQVFRYAFDNENRKHLKEVGLINLLVLKARFVEVEALLRSLIFLSQKLVYEYGLGTFTRKLSRHQLTQIAKQLPPYDTWKNESFRKIKEEVKSQYELTSNDLNKAFCIIKNHYEMAVCLGIEVKIPGLTLKSLYDFFDKWCEINQVEYVIDPPPAELVSFSDVDVSLFDESKYKLAGQFLAQEIDCAEFSIIEALFDFADREAFSENFIKLVPIYKRYEDLRRKDAAVYERALLHKLDGRRAFERILYSLDLLGQSTAVESLIGRYALEPARSRLLERSSKKKLSIA